MAKVKKELDQKYIEDEIATSQQDPSYMEGSKDMPAEQYNSPVSMHKQPYDKKGSKSQTKGYQG